MAFTKQDIEFALARLAEAFPQTFVLEKHRPHRPLKVGIAADIRARCPAVERRVRMAASRQTRPLLSHLTFNLVVPADRGPT